MIQLRQHDATLHNRSIETYELDLSISSPPVVDDLEFLFELVSKLSISCDSAGLDLIATHFEIILDLCLSEMSRRDDEEKEIVSAIQKLFIEREKLKEENRYERNRLNYLQNSASSVLPGIASFFGPYECNIEMLSNRQTNAY